MRLPSLSVIILSQAVIWCVAGTVIHGPTILLYPLSWLALGVAFWYHSKKFPVKTVAMHQPEPDETSALPVTFDAKTQQDDVELQGSNFAAAE